MPYKDMRKDTMLIWRKAMTKKCFIKGVAIFLATFQNIKSKDATQELWFELLQDLTDEQFLYSIKKICLEVKEYYPSTNFIALVREQLAVNTDNEALLAWEAVKKTMHHKGCDCSVEFSDPVIHSVVLLMAVGWAEFGKIPLDKWMQKEFIQNYKVLSRRDAHPEYLRGAHEIQNTAHGYLEHVKKPLMIETGTGSPRRQLGGDNNVMRLAEKIDSKLKVN